MKLSPPLFRYLAIPSPFAIQGSAAGGDWCVSREALFYVFPPLGMKRWIDKIIGSTEDFPCVHEEDRGALSLQVREYKKKCGHYGYLVELFLRSDEDSPPAQIGCFGWEDLQFAVQLIQGASDAIAVRTGVRPLHTVRLWNKTFFVDEKLRVLRNVDDPHESLELT